MSIVEVASAGRMVTLYSMPFLAKAIWNVSAYDAATTAATSTNP